MDSPVVGWPCLVEIQGQGSSGGTQLSDQEALSCMRRIRNLIRERAQREKERKILGEVALDLVK